MLCLIIIVTIMIFTHTMFRTIQPTAFTLKVNKSKFFSTAATPRRLLFGGRRCSFRALKIGYDNRARWDINREIHLDGLSIY